jgi:hypothetical protein
MKRTIALFLVFLSFNLSAQVVEEVVRLDTILEKVQVIYKPVTSTSYYQKKIAVFANDTTKIAIEKTFAREVLNGVYKAYYPSGELKVKAIYANGKINGEYTWYGKDGVIKVKGVYKNDIKDGYWAYKSLKIYGRYKNGKRHKTWYTLDHNLKKIKSNYKKGALVKGNGFGDDKVLTPDTIPTIVDITVIEPQLPGPMISSLAPEYQQAVDFLANNVVFRKAIKEHFGASMKEIQQFKKNYKKGIFQFVVSSNLGDLEISSFIKESEQDKIVVPVIDSILKTNKENLKAIFNGGKAGINESIYDLSTNQASPVTVFFSKPSNQLLRIDVVWNDEVDETHLDLSKVDSTPANRKFKVLLYFDKENKLKGAEYQKP